MKIEPFGMPQFNKIEKRKWTVKKVATIGGFTLLLTFCLTQIVFNKNTSRATISYEDIGKKGLINGTDTCLIIHPINILSLYPEVEVHYRDKIGMWHTATFKQNEITIIK